MRKVDLRPEQDGEQPRQPVAERPGEPSPSAAMTAQNVLALQRTAGNGAVARAISESKLARAKRSGAPPDPAWWTYLHPAALKNRVKTRMRRPQEDPMYVADQGPHPGLPWHQAIDAQRRDYALHEENLVKGHKPASWEFDDEAPPGALKEAREAKGPLAELPAAPWEFDG